MQIIVYVEWKSVTNEVPSLTDPVRPERFVNKVNEDISGFDFGLIKAISPVQWFYHGQGVLGMKSGR